MKMTGFRLSNLLVVLILAAGASAQVVRAQDRDARRPRTVYVRITCDVDTSAGDTCTKAARNAAEARVAEALAAYFPYDFQAAPTGIDCGVLEITVAKKKFSSTWHSRVSLYEYDRPCSSPQPEPLPEIPLSFPSPDRTPATADDFPDILKESVLGFLSIGGDNGTKYEQRLFNGIPIGFGAQLQVPDHPSPQDLKAVRAHLRVTSLANKRIEDSLFASAVYSLRDRGNALGRYLFHFEGTTCGPDHDGLWVDAKPKSIVEEGPDVDKDVGQSPTADDLLRLKDVKVENNIIYLFRRGKTIHCSGIPIRSVPAGGQ